MGGLGLWGRRLEVWERLRCRWEYWPEGGQVAMCGAKVCVGVCVSRGFQSGYSERLILLPVFISHHFDSSYVFISSVTSLHYPFCSTIFVFNSMPEALHSYPLQSVCMSAPGLPLTSLSVWVYLLHYCDQEDFRNFKSWVYHSDAGDWDEFPPRSFLPVSRVVTSHGNGTRLRAGFWGRWRGNGFGIGNGTTSMSMGGRVSGETVGGVEATSM